MKKYCSHVVDLDREFAMKTAKNLRLCMDMFGMYSQEEPVAALALQQVSLH